MVGWVNGGGSPLSSIMKFINTCILTESGILSSQKMLNVCKQNDLRLTVTAFVM